MKIRNLEVHRDMPFDEYLSLPGYSYSAIKEHPYKGDKPSAKMEVGTGVHQYLLEPETYPHTNPVIRPLAAAVKSIVGDVARLMEPEMAITANFCHQGKIMPYKGRVDLGKIGRLVVDFKVGDADPYAALKWFRYDRQLSGYCLSLSAKAGVIIHINPKKLKTTVIPVKISEEWWEYKILQYGQ